METLTNASELDLLTIAPATHETENKGRPSGGKIRARFTPAAFPPAGRVKMLLLLLLLVALTSPFQELVPAIDGDGVPSSKDKRATGEVTMKIVGGAITNIKNYPFLVSEMRP